jgi:hypothetical protein
MTSLGSRPSLLWFGHHWSHRSVALPGLAAAGSHDELFMPELHRIREEVLEKTADERAAEQALCRSIVPRTSLMMRLATQSRKACSNGQLIRRYAGRGSSGLSFCQPGPA